MPPERRAAAVPRGRARRPLGARRRDQARRRRRRLSRARRSPRRKARPRRGALIRRPRCGGPDPARTAFSVPSSVASDVARKTPADQGVMVNGLLPPPRFIVEQSLTEFLALSPHDARTLLVSRQLPRP